MPITNEKRILRLKHFDRVLKRVPPEKFNIGIWYTKNAFKYPKKVDIPTTFKDGISCTTAACALGWAALDKRFNKMGLDFNERNTMTLNGRVVDEDRIGQRFFGLKSDETNQLFYSGSYSKEDKNGERTVKAVHVAKKVRALIRKYSK